MLEIEHKLVQLYKSWSGNLPLSVTELPGSGSYRSYYRLHGLHGSVIGAHNDDIRENEAFITFTNHFRHKGLPVPEILDYDSVNCIYLLTDLGDTTLYQVLCEKRAAEVSVLHKSGNECSSVNFPPSIMELYKKAIGWLPSFQVKVGEDLDYTICYPRAAFDRQSMMWDLNYFKYYFLKLAKVPFDEQALENDFTGLCDFLSEADDNFFLYRDFQSRNIMILNDEPWFIDYQGGRKGALQYDVASLLTDGKADIPITARQELLQFYLNKLEEVYPVDREKFIKTYHGFELIRILQALGAYGFRGYYENKTHFLLSIPFALRNLRYLRTNYLIGYGLETLMSVIDAMVENPKFYNEQFVEANDRIIFNDNQITAGDRSLAAEKILTVTVYSFSFKKQIPADKSGNGGGFVFDCRALPNPGRYDEFKQLNGKDLPVIDYLKNEPVVGKFLDHAFSLVDQSIQIYLDRGFNNLQVSFGCTGGQHRSVFCAEELAGYLNNNLKVKVKLIHTEQEKL